jgi:putative peptidoglycan lipid II flippase
MTLIASPLISVWLRHGNFQATDIPGVVNALIFYSLGITGYFLQQIMVRAFYSLQDSRAPVRTGLIAVGVNFVLNIVLIWFLGTGGLAASTAFCSYLQVVILAVMLRKRFGKSILENLMATLVKTIVAVTVMWFVGRGVLIAMDDLPVDFWFNMLRLAAVIPSAAAIYWLAAKLLHIEELALIRGTGLDEKQSYNDQ